MACMMRRWTGFQPVAHIRQRAMHDRRQGVGEDIDSSSAFFRSTGSILSSSPPPGGTSAFYSWLSR